MASREDLADHNARVRRLARDYDKKFRPVVLVTGYKTNLGTESTLIRVSKIAAATARYTDNKKPLSERQVQRLMAEMEKAGAVKTEARFDPVTGRQRSSVRSLNFRVAIRFGHPVEHLWDSPLLGEGALSARMLPADVTPDVTLRVTPDVTPITSSDLSDNYHRTTSPGCAGEEDHIGRGFSGREELVPSAGAPGTERGKSSPETGYIVRRYKSGKMAYARLDRASRLGKKGAVSDITRILSAAEDAWLWRRWPAESLERPETRQARIDFLLADYGRRKAIMEDIPAVAGVVQEDLGYDLDPSLTPDDERSPWNVFYLWRAKSGSLALFCAGDRDFDRRMLPSRAIELQLRPADADEYYTLWATYDIAMFPDRESRAEYLALKFCEYDELAALGIEAKAA